MRLCQANPRHPVTGVPIKAAHISYWCNDTRKRELESYAEKKGYQFHAFRRHLPEHFPPYWTVTLFRE